MRSCTAAGCAVAIQERACPQLITHVASMTFRGMAFARPLIGYHRTRAPASHGGHRFRKMGSEAVTAGWHACRRSSSTGFPQAIIVGTMVRHGMRRTADIGLKRVHRGHTLTAWAHARLTPPVRLIETAGAASRPKTAPYAEVMWNYSHLIKSYGLNQGI